MKPFLVRFCLSVFISCMSQGLSAGELGGTSSSNTLTGVNEITRHYPSCKKTYIEAAAWMDEQGLPRPGAESVPTTSEFHFGAARVQAQLYPELQADGLTMVRVPHQNFVAHSVETYHKSIQNRVELDGFYVLVPAPKDYGDLKIFLSSKFAQVKHDVEGSPLASGEYYLVPVDQYSTLQKILKNESGSAWTYKVLSREYTPPPPQAKVGLFRTGRGTHYDFRENGTVVIFRKDGSQTTFAPAISQSELPYSSHAAILKRQGISTTAQDPSTLTEIAIASNEAQITKFRSAQNFDRAALGVISYELAKAAETYFTAKKSEKDGIISSAIHVSERASATLPEHLRWTKINERSLLTAPIDAGGHPILRVVRPFLFIRSPTGTSYLSHVRLLSPDVVHLQALHASVGELGIAIEKDGLVSGGHLAYEYSLETGRLIRVSFQGNGIISLHRDRGKVSPLTNSEIDRIKREIGQMIPFQEKIELDFPNNDSEKN